MKQSAMFTRGEELPLFSGVAIRQRAAQVATPSKPSTQARLATCPICLDTGRVKIGKKILVCWCRCQEATK